MNARSAVCESRQGLASLILARGVCIDGEPVDHEDPVFERLSEELGGAGVRPGEVVVLADLRARDLLVAALVTWASGAVPMPVPDLTAVPPEVSGAHLITQDLAVVRGRPHGRTPSIRDTAVLHASSGSTGQPKVVRRGIASVLLEAEGYRAGLALVPGDCVAVPIPLVHSLGWGVAVAALMSGCALDLTPPFRINALAARIDSGAASVVALTPPLARLLTTTRKLGDATLRAAMVGAGPVTDDLAEAFHDRFGRPLLRGYGSTETGGTFLGDRGIGKPVRGVVVLLPAPGERGELMLRLAAPVEGYLDGGREPSNEWRTGDIVQHDRDGVVHFIERLRSRLRVNDRFVRTEAVEKALRSLPGVTDVFFVVLPRRRTPEIEDLYAVVQDADGADTDIADRLARDAGASPIPRIVRCAQLPRNTVGKPDRNAVIDLVRREYPQ